MIDFEPLGWDAARLLARLITAIQAERQLKDVSVEGLADLLSPTTNTVFGELSEISQPTLLENLRRMHEDGWVTLDESNPHVRIAPKGLFLCATLRLPTEVVEAVRPRLNEVAL